MADLVMVDSKQNTAVDTIEAFFTSVKSSAGGTGARITAFTASNNGTASASYKGYIFDAAGTVVQAVIPQKIVVKDRFDLGPSIVSQIIPPGGSLRMETSSLNTITFRVTGKEF